VASSKGWASRELEPVKGAGSMSWLLAFAGFAFLIVMHEFGHFLAAKWTGMRVERFFLFFPPKLWSFKRGETEYGVGWLPLGGFVKITGMNPDEVYPPEGQERHVREVGLLEKVESVDQEHDPDVSVPGEPLPPHLRERAYYAQPVWKRIVVIAAGPAMNLVIAFLIFFGLALAAEKATNLQVGEIEDGTPAASVLQPGDRVVAIDGVRPAGDDLDKRAQALTDQVNTHACAGEPVDGCEATDPATIVVDRDGKERTVQATPYYDADAPPTEEGGEPGRFRLGFSYEGTDEVPVGRSPREAADTAVDQMWFITSQTGRVFSRIFEAEEREKITGVVGGYEATRQAVKRDWRFALAILGAISLSLALLNLLPFLPLDGGHIFWSVVEKVRGRRVAFSVMEKSGAIGFILILMLAFIGLSNDIDRIVNDKSFLEP
jgi:regulator of sigma E protease